MSKVSIVKCPDYSSVKEAMKKALELIGGLESVIHPGDNVLLKPNILAATSPERAVTTHPAIVSAMCEFVIEAGGKPVVGDGVGISRPGATAQALKVSGVQEAARKAGATVINFETAGFTLVDVPDPLQFKKLYISNPVLEADVVISLPKLKTHELTYYTGAVKNFFGAIPLKCRKKAHLLGKRELFGEAVADIYSVIKPQFAVMDGIIGMEGNGPSHGKPVNSGIILASQDCISLDIVAAELIGFNPFIIPTTVGVLKKEFQQENQNQTPSIVGTSIEEVRMKFKRSSGGVSTAPTLLTRTLGKHYNIYPYIDQKKCTQCKACYSSCSPEAIEQLGNGSFQIKKEKCILCYCCRELCPNNAVEIKKSLLATLLTAKKRI